MKKTKKPSGVEGAGVATMEPPAAPSAFILHDLGEVLIENVHPDPDNPRSRLSRASVQELAAAISVHGILNPLTVRRNGIAGETFTIVAGHRRFLAAQVVGLKTVPCRSYLPSMSDELAAPRMAAARIAENDQREDLEPLDESVAVRELLAQGLSPADAGALLGRSESWVRRRAGLVGLSPKILKLVRGEADPMNDGVRIATWPVAWLEDLAAVPLEVQEKMLAKGDIAFIADREDLQLRLFDTTADLASVPWDVKEPDIVKGVPSCFDCPKRSSKMPGLFELVGEKSERCLDGVCFKGKHRAHAARTLSLAKKKHPDVLQVHGIQQGGRGLRAPGRALEAYDFKKVTATTKGAKPAVVVDGAAAGSIVYVKPKAKPKPATSGSSAPAKPIGPAELLELKALRRAASEVHKILSGLHRPEPWVLIALGMHFEVDQWTLGRAVAKGGDDAKKYVKLGQAGLLEAVWHELREELEERLEISAAEKDAAQFRYQVGDAGGEAQRVADFLDAFAPKDAPPFDWPEILRRALATEEQNAPAEVPAPAETKKPKGKARKSKA